MRSLLSVSLLVGLGSGQDDGGGGFLGTIGKLGNMLTPFLPPEVRGIASAASGVMLADANRKKGLIDVVTDGSDYGWICLCPSKFQQEYLVKSGAPAAPDKCPEDAKMGCRPAQVEITNIPSPAATPATLAPTTKKPR